ncbi:HAD family hydrolase [Clostridium beijerinckii]|uniref:HAD superfamily hydrolase (TIGR01549 family) n=1 Tax=Clostridium beijerinckii TaxID=1520 RepID=A0A9Q5D1X0_CLOBE|nr:HAD family hydrolase [Clostridium beijerinckii]AQS06649.1 phosphoglycolate phosphatase [Clostridium beijerinckii]MBA2887783.1 HAD superfamily hydrolase (TIGR01549 family) [Clostridium beijerinckii]MBA2901702.1 HAD superfamily hydrolase (TIGR01549 family) [Clostridium beijerinckii]MBA2911410.1 HAD superfamily hydrolase (TIGR01549 family) [Clostridium beijerinckii]MBA9013728.1 HAD superfamily hydrolase (TIGR01549 family) [Clostridium beijerinckii]
MYNCIIFDIDGTLLDTEIAVLSSLQKLVFEELNENLSFDELRFALGIPGEVTLNKLGITNILDCNVKWNKYLKEYFHNVKVFDGIKDTLIKLNEIGILTGIVTSKTKEEFLNDFAPFELNNYFKLVVCADDTEEHKPNPEPILKFIELSGANKSKTIYIGDTKYDMDCSFGAGIDFALALWGAKSSIGINANYILENPKQVLKLAKV